MQKITRTVPVVVVKKGEKEEFYPLAKSNNIKTLLDGAGAHYDSISSIDMLYGCSIEEFVNIAKPIIKTKTE